MLSDKIKAESRYFLWEIAKTRLAFRDLPEVYEHRCLSLSKVASLKMDVLRWCELFRVSFFMPYSRTFGSYYVVLELHDVTLTNL